MIIAISGPSASGKGTLARVLAKELHLPHYDFGLMFRAIAFLSSRFSLSYLLKFAEHGWLRYESRGGVWFKYNKGPALLFEVLKTEEVALMAAKLTVVDLPMMIKISQAMVKHEDFVCDGRTCGSEIYPNADYKFYVTAEETDRLGRRPGDDKIERKKREKLDSVRLKVPERAVVIDTTGKTVEESFHELLSFLNCGL